MKRTRQLDTALVDDVVLGCVTPIAEQGGDIARIAVLDAGRALSVAGAERVNGGAMLLDELERRDLQTGP